MRNLVTPRYDRCAGQPEALIEVARTVSHSIVSLFLIYNGPTQFDPSLPGSFLASWAFGP